MAEKFEDPFRSSDINEEIPTVSEVRESPVQAREELTAELREEFAPKI